MQYRMDIILPMVNIPSWTKLTEDDNAERKVKFTDYTEIIKGKIPPHNLVTRMYDAMNDTKVSPEGNNMTTSSTRKSRVNNMDWNNIQTAIKGRGWMTNF